MTITNHGHPVVSSRLWVSGLSRNAANTDWNYIGFSWTGPNPGEWVTVKNFTTTPVQHTDQVANHHYPNNLLSLNSAHGQLLASNGRIFFPLFNNQVAYYDPTTETVTELTALVETPPIDPNASTLPYSATFDTSGILYFATQESQNRPSFVFSLDPATLVMTPLGYVGSGALAYTTYGFHIAVDTGTAAKYAYVAYGENPWQLWALELTTGTATKLYEVPSTGAITFFNQSGQGWYAQIHTNLGSGSDVVTNWWMIDGALVAKTGTTSPSPRSVTPLTGTLTNPPSIDDTQGAGIFSWRAHGSSGAYTEVDYTINYSVPITLESLAPSPDGVLGNGESYNGFFDHHDASSTVSWYGPWASGIAQTVPLYVPATGKHYLTGYPNCPLYLFDQTQPWILSGGTINPVSKGAFAVNGTQNAGTKYPVATAWAASLGVSGRVYMCGTRERNGSGMGVGYYDVTGNSFFGVYSSTDGSTGPAAMKQVLPAGIAVCGSSIVVPTRNISGTGNAPIYVFNSALSSATTYSPFSVSALGPVVPTSDSAIVCGAFISGGLLTLYRMNVTTGDVVRTQLTTNGPTIDGWHLNPVTGTLWMAVGNTAIGVNPDSLAMKTIDISSIAPVSFLAVYAPNLYMASGTTLYSAPIPGSFTVDQIDPEILFPDGQVGYAFGIFAFFDLLISTINAMCSALGITLIDTEVIKPTAETGRAQVLPTFYATLVAKINACATAMSQPTMDANIVSPSSQTGTASDPPEFYAAVIAKVNALIEHL